MGMPRNRRETEIRERKIRAGVITSCAVLGLLGIIACGYGHAAVSTDLLISGDAKVVAKPAGFDAIYMQDLTPQECASKPTGTTSELIDKRDGKSYWAAKIGEHCLMTQDLRLDLTTDGLTSELSDINPGNGGYEEEKQADGSIIYKWNQGSAYPPTETIYSKTANFGAKNNTTYSLNYGEYVWASVGIRNNCKNSATNIDQCSGQAKNVGMVTGTGDDHPAYKKGLSYMETGVSYDDATMTYDSHYLVGNHYQYQAATAGSSTLRGLTYATSSICPRGWRLPKGSTTAAKSEFYIIAEEQFGSVTNMTSEDNYASPFYFNSAGGEINGKNFASVGTNHMIWTNKMSNVASAASMNVYVTPTTSFSGTGTSYVYRGLNVRCILREAEEE